MNVVFADHERHDRCRSLSEAWLLHGRLLQQQQPKAAGILDDLVIELRGVLGSVEDVPTELDRWRDDWLRRAFTIPNQVPMLAVVLAFLLFAHMTDETIARHSRSSSMSRWLGRRVELAPSSASTSPS